MKINNFELVKEFLEFEEGKFYSLQILRRNKDSASAIKSRIVKTYIIESERHLEYYKEEIVTLCDALNARAYIDVCRRNFEKTAFNTLKKTTDLLYSGMHKAMRSVFDKSIGYYQDTKMWVVDIDSKDENLLLETKNEIELCSSMFPQKVRATIPTPNGYHLICYPFSTGQFEPFYINKPISIHKNNGTLLYYNPKED